MKTDVRGWTDGKLFDYMQATLGVGDFDESQEQAERFGPWRVRQIGMLKRFRAKRHLSVQDMVLCTDYCKAHRLTPIAFAGVMSHWTKARVWGAERDAAAKEDEYLGAVEYERSLPSCDNNWVERLLRAHPSVRVEVLAEWRQFRNLLP